MAGDFDFFGDQEQVVAAGRCEANAQVAKCEAVRHERVFVFDGWIGTHGPEDFALRIFETQLEAVLAVKLGEVGVNGKLDRGWEFGQAKCTSGANRR